MIHPSESAPMSLRSADRILARQITYDTEMKRTSRDNPEAATLLQPQKRALRKRSRLRNAPTHTHWVLQSLLRCLRNVRTTCSARQPTKTVAPVRLLNRAQAIETYRLAIATERSRPRRFLHVSRGVIETKEKRNIQLTKRTSGLAFPSQTIELKSP